MWRVVVCDQETLKNEEAKTRYRAVENTTTMGFSAKKTIKQTNLTELTFCLKTFEPSGCRRIET
jgi:hypothetical protein